jgi:hypothetical protein
MWPEMESARQQLTVENEELGPDDPGFEGMTEIMWERRQVAKDYQNPDDVKITNFAFYTDGHIFARANDNHQVGLGPQNQVETWIDEKIPDWTRDKITPYALGLLFIGFALQLLSFWFTNFS